MEAVAIVLHYLRDHADELSNDAVAVIRLALRRDDLDDREHQRGHKRKQHE
jgi:hypothetical protein